MRTIVRSGLAAMAATLVLAGVAAPNLAPVATAATRTTAAAPAADDLLGVSCPASSQCLAVGVKLDGSGGAGGPLAEVWNGRTWHTIAVRLPAGATEGALNGVDCPSARDCLAVGSYYTSSAKTGSLKEFALADTWNGKTWTPATLPAPAGGAGLSTSLSGVSCVSARQCVAVGTYPGTYSQAPLGEIWNGRTWTPTEPPPFESNGVWLDAVSCAAARSCFATGYELAGTETHPLMYSLNGTSWSLTSAIGTWLSGVSCTSGDRCAAVGSEWYIGTLVQISTVQLWNGKSWSTGTVTWPTGTTWPTLTGVSCAAANRCVAVGTIDPDPYLNNGTNTGRAAAQTWNGRAWTAVSVRAPGTGEASVFNAVTCRTAVYCVAVGQVGPTQTTNGIGLSGFWNGKSWRLVDAK